MIRKLLFILFVSPFLINTTSAQNPGVEWVVTQGSNWDDQGTACTTDSQGNVYSTGYFQRTVDFDPGEDTLYLSSEGIYDVFVQKLDEDGNLLWAKSFGGTSHDAGNSIAVDAQGNVFVAGYFAETADFYPGDGVFNLTSEGNWDVFLAKFDSEGNFRWAGSIGGAGSDQLRSMAVSATGDVYMTGHFSGSADFDPGLGTFNLVSRGSNDIYVLKLNEWGDLLWANSMGSVGADHGYDLTVDDLGNVYTTGSYWGTATFSAGSGVVTKTSAGGDDIFVQKIDFNGNLVWVDSFGGVGNELGRSIDKDSFGNLFVTGNYNDLIDFDPNSDNFTLTNAGSWDIFIQKLDVNGNLLWVKDIGGPSSDTPRSLATDSEGNVYLTGTYNETVDFDPGEGVFNLTAIDLQDIYVEKLNGNGEFEWVMPIGGRVFHNAGEIAVDPSDNLFVTGRFRETVDFDPTDGVSDISTLGGSDIFLFKVPGCVNNAVPIPNEPELPDLTNECSLAMPVAPTATTDCESSLPGTTDASFPITVPGTTVITWTYDDGNGNVATQTQNVIITEDVTAPELDLDWLPDLTDSVSVAMPAAPTATDYCEGIIEGVSDVSFPITTPGTTVVTWTYDDGNGHISTQTQNVIIEEPPVLEEIDFSWAVSAGSTSIDFGQAIAMDSFGNVFVTGYFNGTVDFDPGDGVLNLSSNGASDIFIQKFNSAGNLIWAKSVGGPDNDEGRSIKTDTEGNVYITGSFFETVNFDPGATNTSLTSQGESDVFVQKLDSSGLFSWVVQIGATAEDIGNAIEVTQNGSIYVAGSFQETVDFDPGVGVELISANGGTDLFIQKLDIDGNLVWTKTAGGLEDENAESLALDSFGNVYVVGEFRDTVDFDPGSGVMLLTSEGSNDIFIQKIDSSGNLIWAKSLGGDSTEKVKSVTIDTSENIILTGWFNGTTDLDPGSTTMSFTSAGDSDYFVEKLDASGSLVWAKAIGGSRVDWANSVCTDNSGDIYLTGFFGDTVDFDPNGGIVPLIADGQTDLFIQKIASDGNLLFAKGMGGYSSEQGKAILVDSFGNIFFTGGFWATVDFDAGPNNYSLTTRGITDIFLAKYSQCNASPLTPETTVLADITGTCSIEMPEAPTASNDCGETFIGTTDSVFPITTVGTTVITWTFDDGAGNTLTQAQNVIVEELSAPEPIASDITETSAAISWDTAIGVENHTYRYRIASGGPWTTGNIVASPLNLNDLEANTTYEFRIRATCESGNSSLTSINFTTLDDSSTACEVPINLFADDITENGATLNWGGVSSAESYNLQYRETGSASWVELSISDTSTSLGSLLASTDYEYQVQANCATGASDFSALTFFTTLDSTIVCSVTVPVGLNANNITTNSADLSWEMVDEATSYDYQYRVVGDITWQSGSVTTNSVTISSLEAETEYEFQVRAVCPDDSSEYSAPITFVTLEIPVVCSVTVPDGLTTSNITTSSANVAWNIVDEATSYDYQYRIVGDANWLAASITSNSVTISSLSADTEYEFQVLALCPDDSSVYSIPITFTTLEIPVVCSVTIPGGLTASNVTSSSADVSWNTVDEATSYDYQYRIVGDANWLVASITSNSVTISSLSADTEYEFQVLALCPDDSSVYSIPITFTTLEIPVVCSVTIPGGLTASNVTSSSADVSWNTVDEATSYDYQYRMVGDVSWLVGSSTVNTIGITGLSVMTEYEFQVRALCADDSSAFSTVFNFITEGNAGGTSCDIAPQNISAAVTSTTATVSWGTVDGANSYIYKNKKSSGGSAISGTTTSTSVTLTDLLVGESYTFVVKTSCDDGNSPSGSFTYSTASETARPSASSASRAVAGISQIRLFPNPVQDDLTIVIPYHEGESSIKIFDLKGVVLSDIKGNEGVNTLDVKGLKKGIYLITVVTDNSSLTKKFIKD